LKRALELAERQRGFCAPNPSVGAVLAVGGQVIAEGFHQGPGSAHAEVMALQQCEQAQASEATLYVTLEPCCHYGRTPPCTDLIIAKKIKRVVYGFGDPNPLVAGQGRSALEKAAISCELISLPEIESFYQSYHFWWCHQRPFLTAKLAQSWDGKIALAGGKPIHFTGPELDQHTHQLRKNADALMTTVKTVHCDNPRLNVRLGTEIWKKPVIILDRELILKNDVTLFATAEKIILCHSERVSPTQRPDLQTLPISFVAIPENEGYLDLQAVALALGKMGYHDVWIEAGGTLVAQLIKNHLLQRFYLYTAATTLGEQAIAAFQQPGLLDQAKVIQCRLFSRDGLIEYVWPPALG
jgi:diaminohydroxyphosphoribosylaminopyrimidine deaminase/5-amino-6-(5-phosphoribosylamino)uracil reductase